MTIGTLTLFAVTGSLIVLKIALMALAAILLGKMLLPHAQDRMPRLAKLPRYPRMDRGRMDQRRPGGCGLSH